MRFVVTWLVLAAFWAALSGHLEGLPLVMGVLSVTLVAGLTRHLLTGDGAYARSVGTLLRFALYVPWLLWQVGVANVDVLLRVFGLRSIDPHVYGFRSGLESDFAKVALANSITLTPGTVTIDVDDDRFLVHAIAPPSANLIRSGVMERRLRRVEGRGS